MVEMQHEILRSSFCPDGSRIFLMFDASRNLYLIATRWSWVVRFKSVWDACDAFEALEIVEGELRAVGQWLRREIQRVPRHHFVQSGSMGRLNYLINGVERRLRGLRPQRCGSKSSVEQWIPTTR